MTATTPTLGKDRPIIFSAPMVRALLAGRKTQTRRVLGARGANNIFSASAWSDDYVIHPGNAEWRRQDTPYAVGDRLWVRENWTACGTGVWTIAHARTRIAPDQKLHFAADESNPTHLKWWPSIHMPREFSRLTLTVTDVRVERLNDISEADAIAEGMPDFGSVREALDPGKLNGAGETAAQTATRRRWPQRWFEGLWNEIHGAGAWSANPWVIAVTFTVHHANIDALDISARAA